jgi:hypothetical protein
MSAPSHDRLHRPTWCAVGLAASALLGSPAPTRAELGRFAGHWTHDVSASDQGYLSGEFPGMALAIEVDGEDLRITQWVGEVQDGIPLPGSGDTTVTYEIATDGNEHRLPLGHTGWRTVRASRQDETVLLSYPFGPTTTFVERWSVSEDGTQLHIERTQQRDGHERRQRIVFRRAPPPP